MSEAKRFATTPLAPGFALLLAIWFGLLTGLVEVALMSILKFVMGRRFFHFGPPTLWMAPVAEALLFLGIAALLLVVGRFVGAARTARTMVYVFAATGFFAGLLFIKERVHIAALLVLAIGLATPVTKWSERWSDRFRRLVLSTTGPLAVLVLLLALAVHGGRALAERRAIANQAEAVAGAPSVILIIWDTVRALSMGAYGYERATTPELERLAAQGVLFENAIAPAPWTLPSHASMFTGRPPRDLGASFRHPFDGRYQTIAQALQERGYATAAFVANFNNVGWESGLSRGFQHFEGMPVSPGQMVMSVQIGRRLAQSRTIREIFGYYDFLSRKRAPDVEVAMLDWLAGRRDQRPFFAFINYLDAHAPYLPPAPYDSLYGRDTSGRRPLLVDRIDVDTAVASAARQLEIDAYDGSIAYLDRRLAWLFGRLTELGALDNTLVILASDHGEELGEHGRYGHGDALMMQLLRVPLAVWMPGRVPVGLEVTEPVSLQDLPATILDLLGVRGASFPGTSLSRFWMPGVLRTGGIVAAEERGMRSVVFDGYHYIRHPDGAEELYQFLADPAESNDLADQPAFRPALSRGRALVASLSAAG